MNNYNTNRLVCQEDCHDNGDFILLDDTSVNGKERPWQRQKALSEKVAEHYRTFDNDKAERMLSCADYLVFRLAEGGMRLRTANFCRVRLCPMCQWRRALKVYGQMSKICDSIDWDKYALISMVLTVRNCQPEQLGETLDMMMDGYHKFMQYKAVDKIVKGAYRACEVTICNRADEWHGTLHPHFHCLLLVNKSYFKSRDYLSQRSFAELWQRACKLDYMPDVAVQRVYMRDGQTVTDALKEVCKYTLKTGDLVYNGTIDKDKYFALLDTQLANRRFIGLSGLFKELHKQLNLSGIEDDGDLIHTQPDDMTDDDMADIVYIWRSGAYYMTDM